jgi:hypothetical protein
MTDSAATPNAASIKVMVITTYATLFGVLLLLFSLLVSANCYFSSTALRVLSWSFVAIWIALLPVCAYSLGRNKVEGLFLPVLAASFLAGGVWLCLMAASFLAVFVTSRTPLFDASGSDTQPRALPHRLLV